VAATAHGGVKRGNPSIPPRTEALVDCFSLCLNRAATPGGQCTQCINGLIDNNAMYRCTRQSLASCPRGANETAFCLGYVESSKLRNSLPLKRNLCFLVLAD
jgi:hypothetical protein